MATIKVSEAEGHVLDWLVMKIEFDRYAAQGDPIKSWVSERHSKGDPCGQPSTDWAQGGPIIDRECIDIEWVTKNRVRASLDWLDEPFHEGFGPTPLIAAMRCYVTSKLGPEVEVPDELITLEK